MKTESSRFIRALRREKNDRPPFWFMRQAGRYLPEYREIRKSTKDFLSFCYSPEKAAEVTLQPLRRFDMDAAILFSDILVIPHALGMHVEFREGEGPHLGALDIAKLDTENVGKFLAPVCETVSRVSKELPEDKALIGFAGAPWTVATYMVEGKSSREFAKVREMAYRTPDDFKMLMNIIVDATSEYLIAQVKHGADALQLFDSWAGVLPEEEFEKWVIAPTRKIVEKVKASCPEIPIIGFPRGAGILYEHFVKHTGVDAVSIDTTVPLQWAKEVLQPLVTVQGNLDPLLLASDERAAVKQTEKILSILGDGPFIFNLGHGIVPHTPIAHVEAVSNVIRNWK